VIQQRHLWVKPDVFRELQPRLGDAPRVRRRHHEPAADLRATSTASALLQGRCAEGSCEASCDLSFCAMLIAIWSG